MLTVYYWADFHFTGHYLKFTRMCIHSAQKNGLSLIVLLKADLSFVGHW